MTDAIDYLEGYLKGKSDGRKEVVDWIEARMALPPNPLDTTYPSFTFTFGKWQAKLKEWGI